MPSVFSLTDNTALGDLAIRVMNGDVEGAANV